MLLKSATYTVSFLIMIYIVRRLTVKDFGLYNLLYGAMGYIGLLSSLGIPSTFQRFLPEFFRQGELHNIGTLVRRGILIRSAVAAGLIILALILAQPLDHVFKAEEWSRYFLIFSWGILCYMIVELLNFTLTSIFAYKPFALINICYALFRAVMVFIVLKAQPSLGSLLFIEAGAFAALAAALSAIVFLGSRIKPRNTPASEFPTSRITKYAGSSYFNEMGNTLFDPSTSYFLIAGFLNPIAVGIYAFAGQVLTQISKFYPHVLFQDIIRPMFFSNYSESRQPELLEKYGNFLVRLIAFYTFPLVAGVFILGRPIITMIFDPKYLTAYTVLVILSFFKMIFSMQFPFLIILQSLEKVRIIFYANIFAVLNVIGSIVAINVIGINGAALAACLCALGQVVFLYYFTVRCAGFHLEVGPLITILINTAVMTALLLLIQRFAVGVLGLIAVILIAAAVYLAASYFVPPFNTAERRLINRISGMRVFQVKA